MCNTVECVCAYTITTWLFCVWWHLHAVVCAHVRACLKFNVHILTVRYVCMRDYTITMHLCAVEHGCVFEVHIILVRPC